MQRREPVYRAYWTFAAERQRIFERRIAEQPGPWTDDPILARYRFTNAFRMSDRVTQFLIGGVIYSYREMPADDLLVRIVLVRGSSPSPRPGARSRTGSAPCAVAR